jgi:hypothetical protein
MLYFFNRVTPTIGFGANFIYKTCNFTVSSSPLKSIKTSCVDISTKKKNIKTFTFLKKYIYIYIYILKLFKAQTNFILGWASIGCTNLGLPSF